MWPTHKLIDAGVGAGANCILKKKIPLIFLQDVTGFMVVYPAFPQDAKGLLIEKRNDPISCYVYYRAIKLCIEV